MTYGVGAGEIRGGKFYPSPENPDYKAPPSSSGGSSGGVSYSPPPASSNLTKDEAAYYGKVESGAITPPPAKYGSVASPYTHVSYSSDINQQPKNPNEIVVYTTGGITTGQTSAGWAQVPTGINISGMYEAGNRMGTGAFLIEQGLKSPIDYTLVSKGGVGGGAGGVSPSSVSVPSPPVSIVAPAPPPMIGTKAYFHKGYEIPTFQDVTKAATTLIEAPMKGTAWVVKQYTDTPWLNWNVNVPEKSVRAPLTGIETRGTSFYTPEGGYVTAPVKGNIVFTDTGGISQPGMVTTPAYTKTINPVAKAAGLAVTGGELALLSVPGVFPIYAGVSAVSGIGRIAYPTSEQDILTKADVQKYDINNLPEGIAKEDAMKYNAQIDTYLKQSRTGEIVRGVSEMLPIALFGVSKVTSAVKNARAVRETGLTVPELQRLASAQPGSMEYYNLQLQAKRTLEKAYESKFGMLGNPAAEKIFVEKAKALELAFPGGYPTISMPASRLSAMFEVKVPSNLIEKGRVGIFSTTAKEIAGRQTLYSDMAKNFPDVFTASLKVSPMKVLGGGVERIAGVKKELISSVPGSIEKVTNLPELMQQSTVGTRNIQYVRAPIPIYGMTEEGGITPIDYVSRAKGFSIGPIVKEVNLQGFVSGAEGFKGIGVSSAISEYTGKLIQKRTEIIIGKGSAADIFTFKPTVGRPTTKAFAISGMPDVIVTRKGALTLSDFQRTKLTGVTREEITPKLFKYEVKSETYRLPFGKTSITEYDLPELWKSADKYTPQILKETKIGRETTVSFLKYGEPFETSTRKLTGSYKMFPFAVTETTETSTNLPFKITAKSYTAPIPVESVSLSSYKPPRVKPSATFPEIKIETLGKQYPARGYDKGIKFVSTEEIPTYVGGTGGSYSQYRYGYRYGDFGTFKGETGGSYSQYRYGYRYGDFGTFKGETGGIVINPLNIRTTVSPPIMTPTITTGVITRDLTNLGIIGGTTLLPRFDVKLIDLQKPVQKSMDLQIHFPKFNEIQTTVDIQRPGQRQEQPQVQEPGQLLITPPIVIPKPERPTPPFVPPLRPEDTFKLRPPYFPPFGGGQPSREKKKKYKPTPFFTTEVRRRGKFIPVARTTTPETALAIGKTKVRQTLGASFRVRTPKGSFLPVAPSEEFRMGRTPFALVQRKRTRLSSIGEITEFKAARRAKSMFNMKGGFRL